MMWKQIFFRILGVVCLGGGLFAFYDYGRELLPLFTKFVAGTYDIFEVYTVCSSFCFGALALVWVGIRCITLRSFSSAWLYVAVLPLVAWLQRLYDVGLIGTLDRITSLCVVYIGIYVVVLNVALFVHKRWYMPLSHESGRHVSLEKAESSLFIELRWVFLCIGLITLLILHPAPIGETIDMIVSTVITTLKWFVG